MVFSSVMHTDEGFGLALMRWLKMAEDMAIYFPGSVRGDGAEFEGGHSSV